ncbi:hypothetical protein [Sphingomonas sp.]|uniref:hypothetical protein n=1 Tax=Sphingomonas sp. TaxID=28214 RepID=UPI003B008D8F
MTIALALLIAGQATAAAAPAPALGTDTQLSCTLVGPGDRNASRLDLDFRSKKAPNATLAFAADSPFARVGSTSVVARRADGPYVIGFATGNGQYRLELTPQGSGQAQAVRLRVTSVVDRTMRLTVAQGFCNARRGKKLNTRASVPLPVDDAVLPPPWKLAALPSRLPDAVCRVVARDGRVHQFSYQITTADKNELSASYRFITADLAGATTQLGAGTQFYLVAPAQRMVATTLLLGTAAGTAATYVHTTYERLGTFVDFSRAGNIFAVGECGTPPIWIAAAAGTPPR